MRVKRRTDSFKDWVLGEVWTAEFCVQIQKNDFVTTLKRTVEAPAC